MEILFRLCLVTCISLFITKIAKVVESLYVVHLFCTNGLFHTYLSLLFSWKTEKVCVGLEDLCPLLIMIFVGIPWLAVVQKPLTVVESSPVEGYFYREGDNPKRLKARMVRSWYDVRWKEKGEERNCIAMDAYTCWVKKRAKEFQMPYAYEKPMFPVVSQRPNV